MFKYGQYCPLAQALEVLGDRWTLLIIRDMFTGIRNFNDFERGLPGISRGLLASRLRQLEQAGIIEKRTHDSGRNKTEYHLTQAGMDLQAVLNSLVFWAAAWAFGDPTEEELDPLLLMWWMHHRINKHRLPQKRVVVQFNFYGAKTDSYWLLLNQEEVSVCLTDPGFEVSILVTADLASYFQVWFGRIAFKDAIKDDSIRLEGVPRLVRDFPNWFAWSPAATIVHAVLAKKNQETDSLATEVNG
jgi:DNA-binding HxlR family transcriptional regulator